MPVSYTFADPRLAELDGFREARKPVFTGF